MLCTSLCSIGGTLMRRTSPCTRIIGGRPEDRCRSDALFLTTKASSSVRSITILPMGANRFSFAPSTHYDFDCRQPASRNRAPRRGEFVGSVEGTRHRGGAPGRRGGTKSVRRELRTGSAGEDRRFSCIGMAPDRAAPEQQDAYRRRTLCVGAHGGE